MAKKQIGFKTKGMNQDLSVSAFNPEFSFENMNLRLSTNEGNTLMSWVNERGTAQITEIIDDVAEPVYIPGTPIGTAVLNHKLIVFTTGGWPSKDYIFEFQVENVETYTVTSKKLYEGKLNFNTEYPIETLVSYESSEVQKVYWTDWYNQPRVINVCKYENSTRNYDENDIDTIFDFVSSVLLDENVIITKNTNSSGTFAPGVIQYCLTYYNKYGQQSNIVYVSPMHYLSHQNRGASPEEMVNCSFKIRVNNLDENFEYIRLYSIQRTSVNADPITKIVSDLSIADASTDSETHKKYVEFVDSGIYGTSIDPTELLFIGGKPIKALTMTEKDQTLFLGNIKQEYLDISGVQDTILATTDYTPKFEASKECSFEEPNTFYPYKNSIGESNDNSQISTFKGGEYYRFGVQFQRKTGEWSEPIYLGDRQNDIYPQVNSLLSERTYQLAEATKAINFATIFQNANVSLDDYVKVRPLVVFPNVAERSVVCQGVLNPTVFNAEDRKSKSIFSQASWFFRPYALDSESSAAGNVKLATNAAFGHYSSLPSHDSIDFEASNGTPSTPTFFDLARNIEIQGSKDKYVKNGVPSVWGTDNDAYTNTQYFVDQSIVTLNSPEIDFDSSIQAMDFGGLKLRIVGMIDIDSSASSHVITTSTNKRMTGTNLKRLSTLSEADVISEEGEGELSVFDVLYNVGTGKHKGTRMIAGNIWNDGFKLKGGDGGNRYDILFNVQDPDPNASGGYFLFAPKDGNLDMSHPWPVNFFVHPWQASRSLGNDWVARDEQSSLLKTKRMANLLYSYKTMYFSSGLEYKNVSTRLHLQENEQVYKIGLPRQKDSTSEISYYPNIDKVLYNHDNFWPLYETCSEVTGKRYDLLRYNESGHSLRMSEPVQDPVEMKYKSTSHAVIALNDFGEIGSNRIPIMPYLRIKDGDDTVRDYGWYYTNETEPTFWGDTVDFYQPEIKLDIAKGEYDWEHKRPKILWLGELYRDVPSNNLFGGKTKEAIKNNVWLIGGDAVDINKNGDTTLVWNQGDTYYQRYDCLKTYPFTTEDKNQIIEILSFMCETHVNIDGRYDANRGHTNNVNVNPQNFNLINDVYSQLNNFFTSRQITSESTKQEFPNIITYSKTKSSVSDVDLWTNVTLASTLELDGSKGQITSLNRFNDQIIAFQDRAVSQILYNENVQISSSQGVPIEIANSGEVQGKRYLSDFIGCNNKWSISSTPSGIYFMDSDNKGIYMFDGSIKNISGSLGFNTWCKKNIPNSQSIWNPENPGNFVSYYDAQNQEVLFINKDTCLAYSERLGAFTSFYSYENTPYYCNLDDVGIWIKNNTLWQHQAGAYGKFFGYNEPYWMTLVGNPEPQVDKTFTNLEFRANSDMSTPGDLGVIPFDNLEVWNEYQHGIADIDLRNGHSASIHHRTNSYEASLKRKFRIWRCDIPRDNAPEDFTEDAKKGIYRTGRHPMDRMRNPWLYLKLFHNPAGNRFSLNRTEIHDVVLTYFD